MSGEIICRNCNGLGQTCSYCRQRRQGLELARLVLAWDEFLYDARPEGADEPVGQWGEILKKAREILEGEG